MSSEGLVVDVNDQFTGGSVLNPSTWHPAAKAIAVGFAIALVIYLIYALATGNWSLSGETFGNCTRDFCSPTGSPPDRALQEGSQPGAGGYGRQWDPVTGKDVYITPESQRMSKTLESALQGGFAGGPNHSSPTYNRWARDDREKKGMRMYSDLRQKALAQGNEWNQSFADWYKGWRGLPSQRLASDAYYESMSGRISATERMKPLRDSELMAKATSGY